MSRGPGWIQREILAIFDNADYPAFDTSELCRRIYKTTAIEKKHRVAVIRAIRGLVKGRLRALRVWRPEFEKADLVWFDSHRIPLAKRGRPAADPA